MTPAVEVPLCTLREGQRFQLLFHELDSPKTQPGMLLSVNSCSAHVALDGGDRVRTFTAIGEDGEAREVTMTGGARETYWAPNTLVEPLNEFVPLNERRPNEEANMAGKTKKAPKVKVAKVRAQQFYQAIGHDTEKGKALLDGENKKQRAVVYRALRGSKVPLTADQVVGAVDKRSLGSESKNLGSIVRWLLNDLRKHKLAKISEALAGPVAS